MDGNSTYTRQKITIMLRIILKVRSEISQIKEGPETPIHDPK